MPDLVEAVGLFKCQVDHVGQGGLLVHLLESVPKLAQLKKVDHLAMKCCFILKTKKLAIVAIVLFTMTRPKRM